MRNRHLRRSVSVASVHAGDVVTRSWVRETGGRSGRKIGSGGRSGRTGIHHPKRPAAPGRRHEHDLLLLLRMLLLLVLVLLLDILGEHTAETRIQQNSSGPEERGR